MRSISKSRCSSYEVIVEEYDFVEPDNRISWGWVADSDYDGGYNHYIATVPISRYKVSEEHKQK